MIKIHAFLESMKVERISNKAINNARITLEQLNDFKPLDDVDANDLIRFIDHIREKYRYSEGTIEVRKAYIKKYFKYNDREDITKHLKTKKQIKKFNPNDILNTEDINLILENITSPMYEALFIVLYESGARIGEVLRLEINKDVKENNIGYEVTFFGTMSHGNRTLLLIDSAPYIREWLINRSSDSKFLFPIKQRTVFTNLNNLSNKLQREYNFTKPINSHAFRRACGVRLVKEGMQESIINHQMGWAQGSNMIIASIHCSNDVTGESDKSEPIKIVKPKKTAMDMIQEQETEINELRDAIKMLLEDMCKRAQLNEKHPTEYEVEDIRPDLMPTTHKSVEEIKEMVRRFKVPG